MGLEIIVPAVIGGVGWSILGYLQAKANADEEISFEIPKLAKAVIVGGALGAYLGTMGLTANITSLDGLAQNSAIYLPLVAVADKIVSVVYNTLRRFF
jgi:cellobiose-specific phosphotransferase system component IIC